MAWNNRTSPNYQGNNPRDSRRGSNEQKYLHHEHAPLKMELNNVTIEITRDGKITLTQVNKDVDGVEVEDRIYVKPGFVFRLASIISAGRKRVWKDVPYVPEPDDDLDDINN